MLGNGKQLDVGEAHASDVGNQLAFQFVQLRNEPSSWRRQDPRCTS